MKADWNCLLQMLALLTVFRIPFCPSEMFLKFQMAKFMLRIGISRAVIHERILEGISQYLLYMFSEPLIMTLYTRVLGLTSMKVELMSFRYKLFERCINPCLRVFLVIFYGISLSTASPGRRRRTKSSRGDEFFRGHHLCLVLCGPYLELCKGQW